MIDLLDPKLKVEGECASCQKHGLITLLTGTPATAFRKAFCPKCAPKILREMDVKL